MPNTTMETEKWRRGTVPGSVLLSLHPAIRDCFNLEAVTEEEAEVGSVSSVGGERFVFVQSVMTLLTSISEYCKLADQIPQVSSQIPSVRQS